MDNAFHHVPVLFDEVMEWMAPPARRRLSGRHAGRRRPQRGHFAPFRGTARLYGIDRDGEAIAAASARLKAYPGFQAIHGNFHDAKALLCAAGAPPLTGALVDLGVSSHQLDEAARGFSYHEDAPLDMRMDPSQGPTAAEYLAGISQEEFRRILTEYGEEKWAARIAQIFVERRAKAPILTTGDLVAVVDAAIPKAVRRKDDGHPARRTFQAVRIALNDELDPLRQALCDFVDLLAPGGRLLVITFHSLEDRIVKPDVSPAAKPLYLPAPRPPYAPAAKSRWAACWRAARSNPRRRRSQAIPVRAAPSFACLKRGKPCRLCMWSQPHREPGRYDAPRHRNAPKAYR